jgi:fatty acid desaturase
MSCRGTPFPRWLNGLSPERLHAARGYYWRWSHSRHIPDLISPRPRSPSPACQSPTLCSTSSSSRRVCELGKILRHASGNLSLYAREIVPASELKKVVWSSRAYVAVFVGAIGWCIAIGSVMPALFIVLPRFYGGAFAQLFNMMQHAGLAEDVWDHRLNTRTVRLNPVFSFLYVNMNYHVEHHMFPAVPFHALPRLHGLISDQCPPPTGLGKPVGNHPTLLRQAKDEQYYVRRPLPDRRRETPRPLERVADPH